jgi:DNA-directed RNA polymerase subunit RPC12/RpoP
MNELNLGREAGTGTRFVESDTPRCPKCGWHDVRRSLSRGALDFAFAAFSLAPFRCRTCGHRFFRFFRHLQNP